MVRYCTSGLLYFTSQRRVKYSPQVQCLTILYTPPHAMIHLLYINTKRDDYNSGNPGRSSYGGGCMIIAKPCRFTSVIGNTTIAELESTPKDSDLVGGASSPCT